MLDDPAVRTASVTPPGAKAGDSFLVRIVAQSGLAVGHPTDEITVTLSELRSTPLLSIERELWCWGCSRTVWSWLDAPTRLQRCPGRMT